MHNVNTFVCNSLEDIFKISKKYFQSITRAAWYNMKEIHKILKCNQNSRTKTIFS